MGIIYLGEDLINIGDYAFSGCSSLLNINLPNNVQSLGNYCFFNCTNLEEINFGNLYILNSEHKWKQFGGGEE